MRKCTFVFTDFAEWRKYLWNAVKHLCKGVVRIVFAVVFGIWSIIVHAWRAACRWVGKYPSIALGGFLVITAIVIVMLLARNKAMVVGLETQRDSIAWQYQNFKESHGYE